MILKWASESKKLREGWNDGKARGHPPSLTALAKASVFAEAAPDKMEVKERRRKGGKTIKSVL